MKKLLLVVSCGVLLLLGFLIPKSLDEMNGITNSSVSIKEYFHKEGKYYVYLYSEQCPYCKNVDDEIDKFAKNNKVYKINSNNLIESDSYDWKEHRTQHDIEIGQREEDGKIVFYNNYSELDIREHYPEIHYKIVLANEGYSEYDSTKKVERIYAISTHPILKKEDLSEEKIVIPGIPMLIEFENGEVIDYYFDDKEIIKKIECNIEPLDEYWNIQ